MLDESHEAVLLCGRKDYLVIFASMKGDPPKESLGEDLAELAFSLNPSTALLGMALSADDAYYAIKDLIQNSDEIGFNRRTAENAADLLSFIPGGKLFTKGPAVGEGLVQLVKKSGASNLDRFFDVLGFVSDVAQKEDEPSPLIPAPKTMKRIAPKQIKSGGGVRSLAPRSAPKAIKRIQPKRIGTEKTMRYSPLAMRF